MPFEMYKPFSLATIFNLLKSAIAQSAVLPTIVASVISSLSLNAHL